MSRFKRILLVLIVLPLSISGYSQESNPKKNATGQSKTDDTDKETSPAKGLRNIETRSQRHNWDVNVHIDQKAIEASIESAVENAMKSVEVARALGKLEIQIEPIEIDLGKLDIDIGPIEINIPALDINIEPIDIDLDDMKIDVDADRDVVDRDDDDEESIQREPLSDVQVDRDKVKVKDKADKEKSYKRDKDKSKGLKKIN